MSERSPTRLGAVPSAVSGPLRQHLKDIGDAVNAFPAFSTFSFSTPNSNVTANAPTLGFNVASGSSVLWAKTIGSGNTGWTSLA